MAMASGLLPDWLLKKDEDNSIFLLAVLLFAGYSYLKYMQKQKREIPPKTAEEKNS